MTAGINKTSTHDPELDMRKKMDGWIDVELHVYNSIALYMYTTYRHRVC